MKEPVTLPLILTLFLQQAPHLGDRVNTALRRLNEKHRSGAPPLATTLDLYRELQAVAPGSLKPLLRDLLEVNTFWQLETERGHGGRDGGRHVAGKA